MVAQQVGRPVAYYLKGSPFESVFCVKTKYHFYINCTLIWIDEKEFIIYLTVFRSYNEWIVPLG